MSDVHHGIFTETKIDFTLSNVKGTESEDAPNLNSPVLYTDAYIDID